MTRRAAAENVSKAELTRRILAAALDATPLVKPRARGVFSGPADLAENADAYLSRDAFGES